MLALLKLRGKSDKDDEIGKVTVFKDETKITNIFNTIINHG